MSKEIFGKCLECHKDLGVGDDMVSLVLSVDHIESIDAIVPMKCSYISVWCTDCAPLSIKKIAENAATKHNNGK